MDDKRQGGKKSEKMDKHNGIEGNEKGIKEEKKERHDLVQMRPAVPCQFNSAALQDRRQNVPF